MNFSVISSLCYNLEKESSRNSKKFLLRDFFVIFQSSESMLLDLINFLTLSLQGENAIFYLNDIEIIKAMAQFFAIPYDDLIERNKKIGDLGSTFLFLKQEQPSSMVEVSFYDIVSSFEKIKRVSGKNSKEAKKSILIDTFKKLSPLEGCFYVRFLIGKLRVGISYNTVLDALFEMILLTNEKITQSHLKYAFGVSNNIINIARFIFEKNYELIRGIEPKTFTCIQPQVAQVYIKEKKKLSFESNKYVVQPKIDGFRLQAHATQNTVRLFSRNCLEVTGMFPEIVLVLKEFCVLNNIEEIIFDGEVIAHDLKTNELLSFEETAQRKRVHNIENNINLPKVKYIIFDLLLLNKKNFLPLIYEERIAQLKQMIYNDQLMTIIESKVVLSIEDIDSQYRESLMNGYEGIMIKLLSSIYEPGKRTDNWLKYKQVQKDSLEDSFDLVILGMNFAKGNRRNKQKIGSLLVGVFNEKYDIFQSVAQVGSGGDAQLWQKIEQKISEYLLSESPSQVSIHKKYLPDIYVFPKLVIGVKADKITRSKDHSFGYSIRFPRIISIREDKNEYQTHFPIECLKKVL